jgi:hypothetical protein
MECVECEPGRREVQALHKGWGWLAADARVSLTLWRLPTKFPIIVPASGFNP